MREHRSRPQDLNQDGLVRITRPASDTSVTMKDEGIVQPVSKEMEQLSRRLHQKCRFPGEIRGACFALATLRYVVTLGRRPRPLKPDTAAYIAGLIDGEGTVTLSRLHSNESRRLVVSIANTEIQLLKFVIEQVGAGKITRKRSRCVRHTPSFCYSISSQQALELLEQVSPWMLSYKRRRADLAIKHYTSLTPRNGKYTDELLTQRYEFEQALLSTTPQGMGVELRVKRRRS